MVKTVLIYLEQDNKYLMLYRNKRDNDYNKGYYIGIGGHIEQTESKEEALIREVKEETNLDLLDYTYRGFVLFKFKKQEEELMHVFWSDKFSGSLKENDEGEMSWIDKNKIFDLHIFESDKLFLKLLMETNDYFEFIFDYDSDDKFIGYTRIRE